jgi:hypothetical protein
MVLDKETEEFFNVSTPLGTLDALQAQSAGADVERQRHSAGHPARHYAEGPERFERRRNPRVLRLDPRLPGWGMIDPEIGFEFEPQLRRRARQASRPSRRRKSTSLTF